MTEQHSQDEAHVADELLELIPLLRHLSEIEL